MRKSYPDADWRPAHPNNYSAGLNRPNKIIIHVAQGTWGSCVNWFQNPAAEVSAHFTVATTGRIAQSLGDLAAGYHAGNWNYNKSSIGIEHAGYVNDPSWFTDKMYHASARLTAWLCKKWGIPVDREHILAHSQIPGTSHTDPGPHWDWPRYMRLVRQYRYGSSGSSSGSAAKPVAPEMVYFAPGNGAPANDLADAGVRALRLVGVHAHKCTDKADHDWALKKAIEGKLGEYPYIIVGPAGWEMTDQAKTVNSGKPGDWLPRNRTDIWAAIYSGDYAGRRSAVETHVGVAANRAGKDGAKARRRFRESLGKA